METTVFKIDIEGVKAFKKHLREAVILAEKLQSQLDKIKEQGLEIEIKHNAN